MFSPLYLTLFYVVVFICVALLVLLEIGVRKHYKKSALATPNNVATTEKAVNKETVNPNNEVKVAQVGMDQYYNVRYSIYVLAGGYIYYLYNNLTKEQVDMILSNMGMYLVGHDQYGNVVNSSIIK